MTEVKRYVQRSVEIEAFELTQYGDFVRAAKWVNENGGSAVFASSEEDFDYLIIQTLEGNVEAGLDYFVIRGVQGEFYPCRGDIFRLTYDAVSETPYVEPLTGTGSYVVGRPDGRKSLVGGAALELPT